MNRTRSRTAVVLINLGTPDKPEAPAIRRYLREFLLDRRVVSIPRLIWLPVLFLLVLPVRPRRLAAKYELIWGRFDGPIRNITRALAKRTGKLLSRQYPESPIPVEAAMTYGRPSVREVVGRLQDTGITRFLFLPLYPQYASATTAAAHDEVCRALSSGQVPEFTFIRDYHDHPAYIHALTRSVEHYSRYLGEKAMLVFSFHGIPVAQAEQDPYEEQCRRTADLVASALGLQPDEWTVAFQSRFGRARWLQPATSDVLTRLPDRGITTAVVICPGFATDCLETIEEIRVLNRELFLQAGGRIFKYVRALNASSAHAGLMAELVTGHLAGKDHAGVSGSSAEASTRSSGG